MTDDRAVGQPARRFEHTLGGERGRVVHRGDEDLSPGIGGEEPPEERCHLGGIAPGIDSRHGRRRQVALEPLDDTLRPLGDAVRLRAEWPDEHSHHRLPFPRAGAEAAQRLAADAPGGGVVGSIEGSARHRIVHGEHGDVRAA